MHATEYQTLVPSLCVSLSSVAFRVHGNAPGGHVRKHLSHCCLSPPLTDVLAQNICALAAAAGHGVFAAVHRAAAAAAGRNSPVARNKEQSG